MLARSSAVAHEAADGAAYFTLDAPRGRETAVIVEVPHAGTWIPPIVTPEIEVDRDSILRDSDLLVDRCWDRSAEFGATLLMANVSRYVVDLNRASDDIDLDIVPLHPAPRPRQSRGVVWRRTIDGRMVSPPLTYDQFRERLALFHVPYHDALRRLIAEKQRKFGFVILVAAHSMPSKSRDGTKRRADIVPGTRGRTSADRRVIDAVERHFRAAGLTVRHDEPYRGGWTTMEYGRPREGVHAIQIELNRALYADEQSLRPKTAELAWMRSLTEKLLVKLGALDLR